MIEREGEWYVGKEFGGRREGDRKRERERENIGVNLGFIEELSKGRVSG